MSSRRPCDGPISRAQSLGFTLIELMIAMTISLLVLSTLVGLFVNISRNATELAKTNNLIENGRFAIQLLEADLVHAGFWAGYVPEFDDLSSTAVPGDAPSVIPDPCQAYNIWDSHYRNSLLGIAVQSYQTLPAGAGCLAPAVQRAGTDVVIVRHAENCVPGVGNCDADVAGRLYLQPSFCAAEKLAGTVQAASANTVTLDANASATNNAYVGLVLHATSGIGAGQYRAISAYDGAAKQATLSAAWTTVPSTATTYAFEYTLGTTSFPLHKRDCVGTGTPASLPIMAGTVADKRRFISNIYYIGDFAHPDRPGELIPTLMRSQLDFSAGALAHQPPVKLIDGIEAFRVELGIDNVGKSGAAVDYTSAVAWADPNNQVLPSNRGDGVPDVFVRCTDALPCTIGQLENVVAVKVYVLSRNREPTPGYTDTKAYCLGESNADGTCPAANRIAPASDSYKRHVFTSSVRINNVSARRETP